jgi:hypothetical protein
MLFSVKVRPLSCYYDAYTDLITSDERQEHLDNESEITSLVQTPSFDSEYLRNTLRETNNNNTNGWFDRLFKRSRRGDYEEIGGD